MILRNVHFLPFLEHPFVERLVSYQWIDLDVNCQVSIFYPWARLPICHLIRVTEYLTSKQRKNEQITMTIYEQQFHDHRLGNHILSYTYSFMSQYVNSLTSKKVYLPSSYWSWTQVQRWAKLTSHKPCSINPSCTLLSWRLIVKIDWITFILCAHFYLEGGCKFLD